MDKYLTLGYLLYTFELLACVTGLVYWRKLKHSYWRWFVVYLAIIFGTELCGEYAGTLLQNLGLNFSIYNYFGIPLQFLFFYWIFYKWFKPAVKKSFPLIGVFIYIFAILFETLYLGRPKTTFLFLSYVTGSIVLLLLILMFFFDFINSREILFYRKSIMFWVCLGLLCFYLGTLPFFGLYFIIGDDHQNIFRGYAKVVIGLDCLMYLIFSIGFIWGSPK